jgi:DNA helicase II / ATP-dependent DNA helicase PcrA
VVVANNVRRKGKNLWTSRQGGAKIGYYEAPDGENEALFAADTINRYVRAAGESGETARAAVLYRTNSQSRLFEEAMRRYQLKYHVVGGFSFYERAEIKDLISYLKVIQNPDDSVSLLRVINTPVRGIGKTTIEMIGATCARNRDCRCGVRWAKRSIAAVAAGAGFGGFGELSGAD